MKSVPPLLEPVHPKPPVLPKLTPAHVPLPPLPHPPPVPPPPPWSPDPHPLIPALPHAPVPPSPLPDPFHLPPQPDNNHPAPVPVPAGPVLEVAIDNFAFNPSSLSVSAGSTVTWVNKQDHAHSVTSSADPVLFNSGMLATGRKFTHKFTDPGTFDYHCSFHSGMKGKIIVK